MAIKPRTPEKAKVANARDVRLKAALKANLARRKAQTRARGSMAEAVPGDENDKKDNKGQS